MTAPGRRRLIAVFTLALVALAVALTGTADATLTGSGFDTSGGTEAATTALSWQNVVAAPALGTELGGTTCFGGGEKELTPDNWTFTTGTACTPGKSDLLGTFSYNEMTASDSFLHLAYDRAATTGDTFITFELNQTNATWTNSAGATVPCRTNNDLLLSYQLSSGSVTITVYKWTGDGTGPAACPNGANGSFTQASSITEEGSINTASITNYLSTGTLGASFAAGAFGEGSLSMQSVIQSLELGCISYIQLQAHTRSSSSISSSLIADMAPIAVQVGNCAAAGTVYDNTAGDGTHHIGEAGIAGVTVYADMTNAGHYVAGDPTTTTDSSGAYLLSGVATGSHSVGVIPPAGSECTSPSSPCSYPVTFSTTANAVNEDFELYSPPPPAAPALVTPANGSLTNNNEPPLTATGDPGSRIDFYLDGTDIGHSTADVSGVATLTPSSPIADGSHTAFATETSGVGGVSSDSNVDTFTVKTSVAAPVVTSPANSSVSSNTSPTVAVTGEPGDSVTLDIDGTTHGPVTLDGSGNGSLAVGPLSAGQHAVKARQTDAASNVSAWSATSIWTIKTQTNVHLTGPSPGPTATNEPTVAYTGEAGDDFTVTVDGTSVATGVIPPSGTGSVALTSPLADGAHTIAIVATDAAENQASDSVVITVVTSNGRTVQFTQAPAHITQQTTATFAFTDGAGTDTYECSLDGGAFAACPSPDTFAGLGNGPHSLVVRGVDSVGNRTAGVQYAWVLDTIAPPAPPILGGPNPVSTPGPATFTISAEPGDALQCSLDASAWGPCPSAFTLGDLPDGPHVLQVRQIDEAGNVSPVSTYVWTVVAKPAPTGQPASVKLVVAAKATVYNRTTVDVGCNLNAGMVKSCTVNAYYHGKLVGTGLVRYASASHQRVVIHVRLNALGRRLMSRAKNGLAVRFTGAATAFNVQNALAAATRSTLFGPVRFVLGDVLFDTGSATLTPQAHAIVSQLARRLKGVSTVRCEGYTDSVGSPAANMTLGLNRARAVCSLLRADGVHAVYRVVSYGASRPVASNATIAGRRINRRVVVWVSYHDVP